MVCFFGGRVFLLGSVFCLAPCFPKFPELLGGGVTKVRFPLWAQDETLSGPWVLGSSAQ